MFTPRVDSPIPHLQVCTLRLELVNRVIGTVQHRILHLPSKWYGVVVSQGNDSMVTSSDTMSLTSLERSSRTAMVNHCRRSNGDLIGNPQPPKLYHQFTA